MRARYPDAGCLWGATSTFASPGHGDRVRGRLVWDSGDGCGKASTGSSGGGGGNGSTTAAALPVAVAAPLEVRFVRRGHCAFAVKSRTARRTGASALVVVDYADSQTPSSEVQRTLVAGDGGGDGGLVPSLLLGREEAAPLVDLAEAGSAVEVELRWDLQRPVVALDMWLSLGDPEAVALLRGLAPTARALRQALRFRAHYFVVALPSQTFPAARLERDCFLASPQFCAELGAGRGTSGAELLGEAVRQHCIIELYGAASGEVPEVWWHYMESFFDSCSQLSLSDDDGLDLASCSRSALASAGLDPMVVDGCTAGRGLAFLEEDREGRAWGGPLQVALRVNGWRYSGPVEAASVLRAVCRSLASPPLACAPYLPAAPATESQHLPAWALTSLCLAASAAFRSSCRASVWLMARCRRARWKHA